LRFGARILGLGPALLAAALLAGCGAASRSESHTAAASASLTSGPAQPIASTPGTTTSTTTTSSTTTRRPPRHRRRRVVTQAATDRSAPPPPIVQDPIPFGAQRKAEMLAYARRHYGLGTYHLVEPHVIVIHFTETPDFSSTFNTFAPDTPDSELHELPNTCAHFVIDKDGTIHQLVPLDLMCRHTVGLNWTAIGIEHVGYSDRDVLGNPREFGASLALVRWLRCRFHIAVKNVIGHNESLSSPYHHENNPALRTQTHNDFNHADMDIYRAKLASIGGCPVSG
jgi:N-acetylmuramoyl-L-alanine amidase